MEKLGLIAGNGRFPILFAKGAKNNNVPVIAVAIEGETSPEVGQYVENSTGLASLRLANLLKFLNRKTFPKQSWQAVLRKAICFPLCEILDSFPI